VNTLVRHLERGLAKVGGRQEDLATALGISRPRVNDLLNEKGTYTLGVRPCFQLAALLREDPLEILKAANKAWLAELLQNHFQRSEVERLSTDEDSILRDFEIVMSRFPQAGQRLRGLLGDLATEARTEPLTRRRRKTS
jgi:plasmid maintenance system antidote protein VapI